MQAHHRVEDEQAGPDTLDGVEQALSVVMQVKAQDRDVDDGDVEVTPMTVSEPPLNQMTACTSLP